MCMSVCVHVCVHVGMCVCDNALLSPPYDITSSPDCTNIDVSKHII